MQHKSSRIWGKLRRLKCKEKRTIWEKRKNAWLNFLWIKFFPMLCNGNAGPSETGEDLLSWFSFWLVLRSAWKPRLIRGRGQDGLPWMRVINYRIIPISGKNETWGKPDCRCRIIEAQWWSILLGCHVTEWRTIEAGYQWALVLAGTGPSYKINQ